MKKVAVVYWSGTGNTEAMANAVAEGAKAAGAEVTVMTSATFTPDKVDEFDSIAFGCPSMGDEVLEETEFDPMFTECESVERQANRALRFLRMGQRRMDGILDRTCRRRQRISGMRKRYLQ